MRTRSSRLFAVLLHLVGVCQYHPDTGIVGVQPTPVQLQSILLSSASHGGREGDPDMTTLLEPVWLQDQADSLCLGPTGVFTECGDATLWFLRRHEDLGSISYYPEWWKGFLGIYHHYEEQTASLESMKNTMSNHGRSASRIGWSFHVVDRDWVGETAQHTREAIQPGRRARQYRYKKIEKQRTECLHSTSQENEPIPVSPCQHTLARKREQAEMGVWLVDDQGRLQSWDTTEPNQHTRLCLYRSNGTAVLWPCASSARDATRPNSSGYNEPIGSRFRQPVQFTFIRYKAVPAEIQSSGKLQKEHASSQVKFSKKRIDTIPSSRDKAHSQASEPQMHPELKLASQLLFSSLAKKRDKLSAGKKEKTRNMPLSLWGDTNPILLASAHPVNRASSKSRLQGHVKRTTSTLIQSTTRSVTDEQPATVRVRSKIQSHPYLENAKNDVWTDPLTGLEYFTDLSDYLGFDRKERGRFTLMGIGQFRKYVIKVYGVAFYVSKRDVLADPTFVQYARLSAEELRARPDFYEHLQRMNLQEGTNVGRFERTLLLKTNMQLSTDTMRSSLSAEWKLLTDEAKELLSTSSLRSRPADENMLRLIQSPDNPSRCSCSQTAPPEYNADPGCCARGTELAFTWLKNGSLEVRFRHLLTTRSSISDHSHDLWSQQLRLNGRVMEVYPRPDIAEGIFFEYLRYDDPMSPELREHLVDGFPFLLAPLAQLKGVKFTKHSKEELRPPNSNPLFRVFESVTQTVQTQAGALACAAQKNVGGGFAHLESIVRMATSAVHQLNLEEMIRSAQVAGASFDVGNAIQGMLLAAIDFAEELNHRREFAMSQSTSIPDAFFCFFSAELQKMQTTSREALGQSSSLTESGTSFPSRRVPMGRVFGYPLSRWFGESISHAPDEIGPMKIHPTMNAQRKVFLTLVHLYLLLLFIVSFPGSYSTKTKIVLRKTLIEATDHSVHTNSSVEESSVATISVADNIQRCTGVVVPACTPVAAATASTSCSALRRRSRNTFDEPIPASTPLNKKSFSYFL